MEYSQSKKKSKTGKFVSGHLSLITRFRSVRTLKAHHVQDHQEDGQNEARDPQADAATHVSHHIQTDGEPGVQVLCAKHHRCRVLEQRPEEFWHVELPSFPEPKNARLPEVRISKRRLPGIWDAQ